MTEQQLYVRFVINGEKVLCNHCLKKKDWQSFFLKKTKKINKKTGAEELMYRFNKPCKECCKKIKQTDLSKEKYKQYRYKKLYGLDTGTFEEIIEEQDYCCAICGKHRKNLKKDFHLDHNHKNGKRRGLLCSNCNSGFGFFKEDISILQSAIEYKKKWG